MLRVVRSRNGAWDGLDQLEDEPKPSEQIFVYRACTKPHAFHLCCRGKGKSNSGWYQSCDYRLLPDQPADEHVRTTAAWSAWCDANRARLLDGSPLETEASHGT